MLAHLFCSSEAAKRHAANGPGGGRISFEYEDAEARNRRPGRKAKSDMTGKREEEGGSRTGGDNQVVGTGIMRLADWEGRRMTNIPAERERGVPVRITFQAP